MCLVRICDFAPGKRFQGSGRQLIGLTAATCRECGWRRYDLCGIAKTPVAGWLLVKIDFYGVIVGAMTHNGGEIRPLRCWRPIKGQRSIQRMVFCPSF